MSRSRPSAVLTLTLPRKEARSGGLVQALLGGDRGVRLASLGQEGKRHLDALQPHGVALLPAIDRHFTATLCLPSRKRSSEPSSTVVPWAGLAAAPGAAPGSDAQRAAAGSRPPPRSPPRGGPGGRAGRSGRVVPHDSGSPRTIR